MSSNFIPTYFNSQSILSLLMDKNNQQYDHSDESVVAKMSELVEEMRTEVLDQLDKIKSNGTNNSK